MTQKVAQLQRLFICLKKASIIAGLETPEVACPEIEIPDAFAQTLKRLRRRQSRSKWLSHTKRFLA